jgi:hypothetical protein
MSGFFSTWRKGVGILAPFNPIFTPSNKQNTKHNLQDLKVWFNPELLKKLFRKNPARFYEMKGINKLLYESS